MEKMKLVVVKYEYTAVIATDDPENIETDEKLSQELINYMTGSFDKVTVKEIKSAEDVPDGWECGIPFRMPKHDERTVSRILREGL